MDIAEMGYEVLEVVRDKIDGLSLDERIMLLLFVSENCKCHAECILAKSYHYALYERKGGTDE